MSNSEKWLYEEAEQIFKGIYHNMEFEYEEKFKLNEFKELLGTREVKVDIFGINEEKKAILLCEAKQYLSVQAVAECSAHLDFKIYILNRLGKFKDYKVLKYILLGGNYENHKISSCLEKKDCLSSRFKEFKKFLDVQGKKHVGLILIEDKKYGKNKMCCKLSIPMKLEDFVR